MSNLTIKTADTPSNEEIIEAMSILEAETKRRVEDISQRMEFMCASLRAQGNTQINKMLMAIRELTVEEFCEKYGADTQYFMSQQTIKRLGNTNKKRPSIQENEKSDTTQKKRSKTIASDEEGKEKILNMQRRPDFGPLFVYFERKDQPKISIQLNPGRSIDDLGKLTTTAPHEILTQLDETQRSRVRDQIQDVQDQLESLKETLL